MGGFSIEIRWVEIVDSLTIVRPVPRAQNVASVTEMVAAATYPDAFESRSGDAASKKYAGQCFRSMSRRM